MLIALAQVEFKTGDLAGNKQRVLDAMSQCSPQTLIVFPELLSGYNCGALFESAEFIDACQTTLQEIAEATVDKRYAVIIGCPRYAHPKTKKNGTVLLHNSAYLIYNGEIMGVTDKILLANDFQHEDRKYFVLGTKPHAFHIWGKTIGVLICEDIWRNDHDRDLVGELKHENPNLDTVVCCNYSYFTYSKHPWRQKLLREIAKEYAVNIAYVNTVGVGDITKNIITYDGQSLAYNMHTA